MEAHSNLNPQKPAPQQSTALGIGRAGFHLNAAISGANRLIDTQEPELRVSLILVSDRSTEHFAALEAQKAEIEKRLGQPLLWHLVEGNKQHRIYVRKEADFTKEEDWPTHFEWLQRNLETFHAVLGPIVRTL